MKHRFSPAELLEIAKRGERRLGADERRSTVRYLQEHRFADPLNPHQAADSPAPTKPWTYSNYDFATLFQVSERTIRDDKAIILDEVASEIEPNQAMKFVAAALRQHQRLIAAAEEGLAASVPGGLGHQQYLKILSDLEIRVVKLYQDIGIVKHTLGELTVTDERWIAEITEGVMSVRRETDDAGVNASEPSTQSPS